MKRTPKDQSQSPAQPTCYANRHLTVTLWGLYDLCKTLAHENNGILEFSTQSLADLFETGSKSMISKQIQALVKRGWFELVKAKQYFGAEASSANHYRVLSHTEWVRLYPGQCCTDKAASQIAVSPARVQEDTTRIPTEPTRIPQDTTCVPTDTGVSPHGNGAGSLGGHIVPVVIPSVEHNLIQPLIPVKHLSNTLSQPADIFDSEVSCFDGEVFEKPVGEAAPTGTQEQRGESEPAKVSAFKSEPDYSAPPAPPAPVEGQAGGSSIWGIRTEPPFDKRVAIQPSSPKTAQFLDLLAQVGAYVDIRGDCRDAKTFDLLPEKEWESRLKDYQAIQATTSAAAQLAA